MVVHNQHNGKAIAHSQVSQVVKSQCVPRYGWNMHKVKSRSHLGLNLSSSLHDAALTKCFTYWRIRSHPNLSSVVARVPTTPLWPFEFLTFQEFRDQSLSALRVPRGTHAIEVPKVPVNGFNPAVFRPLTLVLIRRVLGVPLAASRKWKCNDLQQH
jgi:hypothetical protein